MRRCACCIDNRGTFQRGRFGDPDSDWLCPACRQFNAQIGVTWGHASARECHSDRLDTTEFGARLADCVGDDDGLRLNDKQRAIVRLLATGRRTVVRKVQRRIGGRRVYVAVTQDRAVTSREIAAKVGCSLSYVAKIARLLAGKR